MSSGGIPHKSGFAQGVNKSTRLDDSKREELKALDAEIASLVAAVAICPDAGPYVEAKLSELRRKREEVLKPSADQAVIEAVAACQKAQSARGCAAENVAAKKADVADVERQITSLEAQLDRAKRQVTSAEDLLRQRNQQLEEAQAEIMRSAEKENVGPRTYADVAASANEPCQSTTAAADAAASVRPSASDAAAMPNVASTGPPANVAPTPPAAAPGTELQQLKRLPAQELLDRPLADAVNAVRANKVARKDPLDYPLDDAIESGAADAGLGPRHRGSHKGRHSRAQSAGERSRSIARCSSSDSFGSATSGNNRRRRR